MFKKEDRIHFGKYRWQVPKAAEDKTWIITEDILELRWYHNAFADTTWADCAVRHYLNTEFYGIFSQDDKAQIVPVTNANPDHPWFKTKGGKNTINNVFLLSLEEACIYFGDSKARLHHKGIKRG